jgi:hypothetical protein
MKAVLSTSSVDPGVAMFIKLVLNSSAAFHSDTPACARYAVHSTGFAVIDAAESALWSGDCL